MTNNQITYLVDVLCVIGAIAVLLPAIVYLFTEWRYRRDQMFSTLDDRGVELYYQRFFPAFTLPAGKSWAQRFQEDFGRWYGRRHYVIPMMLLAAIVGLGMWGTAATIRFWLIATPDSKPLPALAIAAFLGAYAWVLLDQFGRYQSRNFTKHAVYNGVYRFLIIVPMGFSFSAFVAPNLGVPLAFLLGTFPTQTLMKFGRRLVIDKVGLGEKEEDGPNELVQLQGIGKENAERFQSVGLTTIVGLAWFDPIELTIRTNLEFNYVIDCISQALVWVYCGADTPKLYPFSLRGAQEARYLWQALDSTNEKEKDAANKTLVAIAAVFHTDADTFWHTLDGIADDPYTEFLGRIWATNTETSETPEATVVVVEISE